VTDSSLDDVIQRIRKLLRLAEDAGATEAEAASALERASALLIRHNLTQDQVTVSPVDEQLIGERRIRAGWAGSMEAATAAALTAWHMAEWAELVTAAR